MVLALTGNLRHDPLFYAIREAEIRMPRFVLNSEVCEIEGRTSERNVRCVTRTILSNFPPPPDPMVSPIHLEAQLQELSPRAHRYSIHLSWRTPRVVAFTGDTYLAYVVANISFRLCGFRSVDASMPGRQSDEDMYS